MSDIDYDELAAAGDDARKRKREDGMTREEHLKFCKARAMEYVKRGELLEAVTSMMSDLEKHQETKSSADSVLTALGLFACQQAQSGDRDGVIRYIQGFN